MNQQLLSHIGRTLPIGFIPMASGAVCGVILGLLKIGESTDLATAFGIVGFFSFALGIWLGSCLCLALVKGCRVWLDIIKNRLAKAKSRMSVIAGNSNADAPERPRSAASWLQGVVIDVIWLIAPLCCVIFATGVIHAALMAQLDSQFPLRFAVAATLPMVIVVLLHCIILAWTHWQVAFVERWAHRVRISDITSEPRTLRVRISVADGAFASGLGKSSALCLLLAGGLGRALVEGDGHTRSSSRPR